MDKKNYDQALYEYLLPFVTDNKRQRFDETLALRTRALTVVLEDIFKPHNASAVLRTAECMGLQDVHVVEQDNEFNLNPYVLRGSGKWLTVHHHLRQEGENTIERCFTQLIQSGYSILATTPHEGAVKFNTVKLPEKVAVVFGAEETGISDFVKENADQLIKIPMMGFTESFNISVSAAVILENFNQQIRSTNQWQLGDQERFDLKLEWMKKVVPNVETHIKVFEKQLKTHE